MKYYKLQKLQKALAKFGDMCYNNNVEFGCFLKGVYDAKVDQLQCRNLRPPFARGYACRRIPVD